MFQKSDSFRIRSRKGDNPDVGESREESSRGRGKRNCKQDLYYVKRFIFSIKGKNGLN